MHPAAGLVEHHGAQSLDETYIEASLLLISRLRVRLLKPRGPRRTMRKLQLRQHDLNGSFNQEVGFRPRNDNFLFSERAEMFRYPARLSGKQKKGNKNSLWQNTLSPIYTCIHVSILLCCFDLVQI